MKKTLKMSHKLMLLIGSVIVVAGVAALVQLRSSAQVETLASGGGVKCDTNICPLADTPGVCSCDEFGNVCGTDPDCAGGGGGGGGQCSEPYETRDSTNNVCIDCNYNGSICANIMCESPASPVCAADGSSVCSTACSAGGGGGGGGQCGNDGTCGDGVRACYDYQIPSCSNGVAYCCDPQGGGGGVDKTCFAIYGKYNPYRRVRELSMGDQSELERIKAVLGSDTSAKVDEALRSQNLANNLDVLYTQDRIREVATVKEELTRRMNEMPSATYAEMRPVFDAAYVATVYIPVDTARNLESKYVGFGIDQRACDTTNGGLDCEEQNRQCTEKCGEDESCYIRCKEQYVRCVEGGGGGGQVQCDRDTPRCQPGDLCEILLLPTSGDGVCECRDGIPYPGEQRDCRKDCETNPKLCLADCIGNPKLCMAVVLDSEINRRVTLNHIKEDLGEYFAPIEAQIVETAVAPTENVVANAVDNNVLETEAVVEAVNQAAETAATLILDIPPISAAIDATVQQAITADAANNASEKAVEQIKALNPSVTATEIAAVQAQVTKTVTAVITAKVNEAKK